ncbi:MAG: hypothetical protein GQ574_06555 [Crocinitomix sp.]|nr:hypothetical protein [Crocinitomix sp.]
MRLLALLIVFFSLTFNAKAQETLTVKFFGLAIHPFGDPTANLQPFKLDKKARFVLNAGLFVGYEKYLYKDIFSVKIIQGITTDCSNGLASISHIGARLLLFKTKKHRIHFGIGPTFIVRESWNRFGDEYTSSGFFNEYDSKKLGELQWKLIPYGFEFEYDYSFSDINQLSFSFTPGIPATTLSVGWKHWFNWKDYNEPKIFIPKKKK